MTDQYLDYLAGQQLALARQEDEIIALRGKLQASRETYEAFLESSSPVIAARRAQEEEEVRARPPVVPLNLIIGESRSPVRTSSAEQPSGNAAEVPTREDGMAGERGQEEARQGEESCGVCSVSAANGAAKGNGFPSAKGKAEDGPAARRHTSDDALAPALGISRCEDDASPAPQPDLPTMPAAEEEAQRVHRAAREAQPADEPYDAGPMPGFLRKVRA